MKKMYDKTMISDWLQQAMGELRSQQLVLEGEPASPVIEKGLEKFRSRWGGEPVIPNLASDFALAACTGDDDQDRRKLAETRGQQCDHVMETFRMLRDLGVFTPPRPQP